MMKKILLFYSTLSGFTFFAQNNNGLIDTAGDVVIVALDDMGNDGLAFVLLDEAPTGTSIVFTDDEWTGTSFSSTTTEGEITWINDTGITLNAGKVIVINNANGDGISANAGSVQETDLGFLISGSDDQVTAFTGSSRNNVGTILAFAGYLGTTGSDGLAITLSGTGLTQGQTAMVSLTSSNYHGVYDKTLGTEFNGSLIQVAQQLNNQENWNFGTVHFISDVIGDLTGTVFSLGTLSSKLSDQIVKTIYSSDRRFQSTDATLWIEVYNTLGQKVYNSNLTKGIYILKITNTQGVFATVMKAI